MALWQILATLSMLVAGAVSQPDVVSPPIIVDPRVTSTRFISEHTKLVIPCVSTGTPTPSYKWTQNGTVISTIPYISVDSISGNLTFMDYSAREDATYICLASNSYDNGMGGLTSPVSLSPPLRFFLANVERFDNKTSVQQGVNEYDYVKMTCGGKGVFGNTITYNWYYANGSSVDMSNNRLFIDSLGNLHFTYAVRGDSITSDRDGYNCGLMGDGEKLIRLGTVNRLSVTPRSPVALGPQLKYSNTGVKGLLYTTVKLECVYSGYDPSNPSNPVNIQWYDDLNQLIVANDKYSFGGGGRVLIITGVTDVDEKLYICRGKNSYGEVSTNVFLNVTSGPIFVNGVPIDQTVPEGTDVQFNCDTRSASRENPPGPPIWSINGVRMGNQNDPKKFVLSDDSKILTIRSVKKTTDIMCIQCVVSNSEDTVFANACLNVLLPIRILSEPEPLQKTVNKGDYIDMTVTATTDKSMQLSSRWIFNNVTYEGADHPPSMFYNPNTNLAYFNTSTLSNDQFKAILGSYTKEYYHLYQKVTVTMDLLDAQAVTSGGVGMDMWIIGLIIALILLIIIIALIIFVICRKKQEGDYNVDKKETGAGLDPEKELKEKDFNAFSRPEYDLYSYPDSKPPGGDPEFDDTIINDDESLGEYGKEDITHFNEDGSFIGIYQSKQHSPPPPTESTI